MGREGVKGETNRHTRAKSSDTHTPPPRNTHITKNDKQMQSLTESVNHRAPRTNQQNKHIEPRKSHAHVYLNSGKKDTALRFHESNSPPICTPEQQQLLSVRPRWKNTHFLKFLGSIFMDGIPHFIWLGRIPCPKSFFEQNQGYVA
ncbi:MAG: hypothetical protein ABSC20_00985 [Candidatus Bathyarchaeia archaeon]|jgi:hypothetical protein